MSSPLAGLSYVAHGVEASPGWQDQLHAVRRRTFAADGTSAVETLAGPDHIGHVGTGTAELVAEQGDTLIIRTTATPDTAPLTVVLTVFSPTVGEATVTDGTDWVRAVVAIESLPDAHGHDH